MRLELKDVESSVVYTVDASGAVLGRERARTDINFRDESISKRHARIYNEAGAWFLEDLGSSNGTFVNDQRLTAPVELTRGSTFALAQRRLEVVFIEGDPSVEAQEGGAGDLGVTGALLGDEPVEDPPRVGLGSIVLAVPKAVAHYTVSVPFLALNPPAAVRASIESKRSRALSRFELAAYGLVASGVAALVGAVFGVLAGLIGGGFSLTLLIGALPRAAIHAAIGAVSGFLLHPVLEWAVRALKGHSTARSRTNFGLDVFSFVLLGAIPSGISTVIYVLPIPFPGLVPVVLTLLVSLLGVFIAYRWAVAFEVVSLVRYLLVAVGGIVVLSSAWLGVESILSATERSPLRTTFSGDETSLEAQAERARARAEEARRRTEAARKDAKGSETAENGTSPEGGAAADEKDEPRNPAEASRLVEAPRATVEASRRVEAKDAARPATDKAPAADPRKEARMAAAALQSAPEGDGPKDEMPMVEVLSAEHPRGLTEFAIFVKKRAAIERAIADDPSLLDRKDVLDEYGPLWRQTYEVRERWRKLARREEAWKREKIYARKEEAQIFERTRRYVDKLYGILFESE